ncbi:hypothetical protein VIGAN_09118200 [Vigna angularis var. angularis]|uniref:Uncharacterized protein n=1 Tax=Vigna angularis var. angularis TaxID=157739 RepID=A0A0S3SY19_PHAAN|nr:hypothetical protein VIGAN_09118200 [Vigna angularis var. angularis]
MGVAMRKHAPAAWKEGHGPGQQQRVFIFHLIEAHGGGGVSAWSCSSRHLKGVLQLKKGCIQQQHSRIWAGMKHHEQQLPFFIHHGFHPFISSSNNPTREERSSSPVAHSRSRPKGRNNILGGVCLERKGGAAAGGVQCGRVHHVHHSSCHRDKGIQ